jgi:hypothetical protein
MRGLKSTCFPATVVGLLALGAGPAFAQQQVAAEFQVPLQIQATLESFDCANNPGPQITFEGNVLFTAGASVELIFRNQREPGAPHETSQTVTTTNQVVVPGHAIVIPKQPVLGGVGGNPWISIQILDGKNRPLTSEILLGRCVQGPFQTNFQALVAAVANVMIHDCTNNPGPFIELDGAISFPDGLKARFFFRNQREPGAPHEASSTSDVTLVGAGFAIRFPKQPVLGGVGGNPWISVQFLSGDQPMGTETLLGRCVQLLPGN